jgi:hypothetical protein
MDVEKMMEQQLLQATNIIENKIDAELQRLETLDEDDIEVLRQRRLDALKKHASQKQEWISQGHGSYSEITAEKEFFDVCKKSHKVVCHFYRDSTFRCKIVDKHLSLLAQQHVETRFIKLSVDKAPFLVERLKIKVLPTIALVKDSKTKDYIIGFDDLGGIDEFTTEMLEWRIARAEVIDYHGDILNPPDAAAGSSSKKRSFIGGQNKKIIRGKEGDSDSD